MQCLNTTIPTLYLLKNENISQKPTFNKDVMFSVGENNRFLLRHILHGTDSHDLTAK